MMLTIWLCILLCTIVPWTGATHLLKYKKLWATCSDDTPFLIHRNIALEKCVFECNIRKACLAVNYWTRRSQCDMLLEDTAYPLQNENNTQPCVYVRKVDFEPAYEPLTCQSCNDKTACDIDTGDCVFQECRQLLVPNATIKGNILSVGSKIRIYCNEQFAQRPNETLSICQENGTWSNVPTCHYLIECIAPPTVANAAVSPGATMQGSERVYTCTTGFNDINNAPMTVTCQQNGTWTDVAFECVQACADPPIIPNEAVDTGTTLVGAERYYICNSGFSAVGKGSSTFDMFVRCNSDGTWTNATFQCVPAFACPTGELSFHQGFLLDGTVFQYRPLLDATIYFAGAPAKCAAVGGGLYQILTLAKMNFTLRLMACPAYKPYNFWIDGVYNLTTSVWETTAGTPLPMSHDFWYTDRPNGAGTQNCLSLLEDKGHTWDDAPCTYSPVYAFCESI